MFGKKDHIHELRSLMQRDRLDASAREDLWSLILNAISTDHAVYDAEVLPYLASFPHHFEHQSLAMFERLDELETALRFAPFARFHFALDRGPRGAHLDTFLRSSAARGVHKLTLTTRHAMTPSMLRKLAQTSSLPNLKSLDLTYHELGAKGALALTDGALFGQLEELGLYNSYIGDAGLDALLSSPAPWQLTALDLRGNELGDAAIARFAASTQVTSLRQLALGSNPVKVNGWRALANSPHLDETIKRPYIEAVARHDSTTSNPHKLN